MGGYVKIALSAAELAAMVAEHWETYDNIGLRGDDILYAVGDVLPESREWLENELTGDYLDGTSTIGIVTSGDRGDVLLVASEEALLTSGVWHAKQPSFGCTYLAEHWYLVGSDGGTTTGEDIGEDIVHDPVVIAELPSVPR